MTDGVLNLDKPKGITSHKAVSTVRRILAVRKAGHTGTLDPLATGVLPICIGKATRIAEYLTEGEKSYRATALFGISTDTQDSEGTTVSRKDASHLTEADIRATLPRFQGPLLQTPPMVSAVKHQGQRLYKLARQGVMVNRPPRQVEIFHLEIVSFEPGNHPTATFEISCSKGTYIRTLCADMGEVLGAGAHLIALRRTRVGRFHLLESLSLDDLEARSTTGNLGHSFYTIEEALVHLPRIILSSEAAHRVRCGNPIYIEDDALSPEPVILAFDSGGQLLAIGSLTQAEEDLLFRPTKVLASGGEM